MLFKILSGIFSGVQKFSPISAYQSDTHSGGHVASRIHDNDVTTYGETNPDVEFTYTELKFRNEDVWFESLTLVLYNTEIESSASSVRNILQKFNGAEFFLIGSGGEEHLFDFGTFNEADQSVAGQTYTWNIDKRGHTIKVKAAGGKVEINIFTWDYKNVLIAEAWAHVKTG